MNRDTDTKKPRNNRAGWLARSCRDRANSPLASQSAIVSACRRHGVPPLRDNAHLCRDEMMVFEGAA